jgi:hypothetical protein
MEMFKDRARFGELEDFSFGFCLARSFAAGHGFIACWLSLDEWLENLETKSKVPLSDALMNTLRSMAGYMLGFQIQQTPILRAA